MSMSKRILVRTSDGDYWGQTVGSVVRRVYGRRATVQWSRDPLAPEAGSIVVPIGTEGTAWNVLATVRWTYDPNTGDYNGTAPALVGIDGSAPLLDLDDARRDVGGPYPDLASDDLGWAP